MPDQPSSAVLAEQGIAAGLRLSAELLLNRINSANRVIGTSRLYGDVVAMRQIAALLDQGNYEQARLEIAHHWPQN